jgi:hypothetical protein
MKHLFKIFTICLFVNNLQAQATKGYDVGSNGTQSDSRILDMFENIKNRANSATKAISSIKGSPYFDESFKSSQVEYFGKTLKDNIYLRYNAFSDEMEMGKTANQNSSEEILIKNNKVACVIEGDTYRYLGYINENEAPAVGYVKELFKGAVFSFYIRQTKAYMEATTARTSLERSFPARFVDKTEYYYAIENGPLQEVKLSKKKILTSLKPYASDIKTFINDKDYRLKKSKEVVELFTFLETL